MKTKLVLWGANAQDERILIAMQLRANDNKVDIWTFPEAIASPDFSNQMLNDWRNGAEVSFPEGFTLIERELSVADNLLPDDIKVERTDLVQRAQSEWHFIVLSTKLHEAYKSELKEIEDKIAQLGDYSGDVWDALKGFWNKVQEQVRDRNLFREHADELRDVTNGLFAQLKDMRGAVMNEFEENSKKWYAQFTEILDEIEKKVEDGVNKFPDLFDQLKNTQSQFRGQKMMREHSNELWTRIDNLFKSVKEKKFGNQAVNDSSALERLVRRYEGLIGAVDKMQESIDRDKQELEFQKKRAASSGGQLEAQIREAKIKMINERIKSKEEKLSEMLQTKAEVEAKMASLKEKEAKKAAETPAKAEALKAEAPKAEATPSVAPETEAGSDIANITADASAVIEATEKIG